MGLALEARVRRSDFSARLGDDEFAVLVPSGDADGVMALAEAPAGLERATTAKDAASRAGGGRAVLFGPTVLAGPAD